MQLALLAYRVVAFLTLFAWAFWASGQMRAGEVGPHPWGTLFIATVLAGPFALLAFMGLPWKRQCGLVVLLLVLTTVSVEAYTMTEEIWFLRQHQHLPPTAEKVFHSRWFPNESCSLGYDPATGELWAHD